MTCGRCGQDEKICGKCWEGLVSIPRNHTLLQGLLRSGLGLEEAVEKYKLKINRSTRYPNLVQFKYNQLESDMSDALVRQCRGIIMDEADNWEIVARPFDKFFNYGEHLAASIDWKTARVLEKLDGTCCFLYYYEGWQVATLGSADASGPVGGFNMTFKDLFWSVFTDKGYTVPNPMWSTVTFIFELMTPFNRVVVNHKESDLKLLGARIADGDESAITGADYETVTAYTLENLKAIEETFVKMDFTKQEGYVVVDANYNRIKVKHPGYVRIHHLKDSFTLRNIVDCIRKGEAIELINYFPEHKALVTMVQDSFFGLIDEITEAWHANIHIIQQKEFALAVKDLRFSGVLFAVRNGKRQSPTDALQQMQIDSLIDLLRVKEAKAA